MSDIQLYTKIISLPSELKKEAVDFIDFLKSKKYQSMQKEKKKIVFGYAKGSVILKPNFDEPLEEFKEYM
jgi:Protein of unknown function (DUF2281)